MSRKINVKLNLELRDAGMGRNTIASARKNRANALFLKKMRITRITLI